jgi:hypothetical protein
MTGRAASAILATMPHPTPKQLFALYHLGLDAAGAYKFRNLQQCARHLSIDTQLLQSLLAAAHIDADTVGHVDFALSKWHAKAQFATPDTAQALVDEAWNGYQEALGRMDPSQFFHSVNYDDVWGDGWNSDDDNRGNR